MKVNQPVRPQWRRWLPWMAAVAILLAAIRLALPYVVRDYVNRSLNRAHDYSGRIGDINMRLWRGGYRIQQIKILRKAGDVTAPLFSARRWIFPLIGGSSSTARSSARW